MIEPVGLLKTCDPPVMLLFRLFWNNPQFFVFQLICDVSPGDYHYIQVFNILIRKCFYMLDLKLINRDYFDVSAKIDIPEFKLQILPGYKTSINQYEDRLLMVTEITHKVR